MKILFAVSECVPFIKTGGLADVAGALPPVLAAQGHDVRVILPLYASIPQSFRDQMEDVCTFEVKLCWRQQYCGIKSLKLGEVTYYFIDNEYYFGRSYTYGLGGDEYERFGFFDRAVIDAMVHLDFKADIVHCHDWQTGMIPALLKIQYAQYPFYQDMKTVFTIHNLQYQGIFAIKDVQDTLGLGDSLFTSDKLECYGCANYMKAGLVYADELTTVSPSYADEIQTAFYGERLDGLLRARKDQLVGILNGIDINEYAPEKDPLIYANFDPYHLGGKEYCKQELQKELGLNVEPQTPVLAIISRLSNQKGLDLVECVIREIMNLGVQLVVLGMGEMKYTNLFEWAQDEYPGRVAARFVMDTNLAHRIYAGADMFMVPSQFEPCGLTQMISMRYGAIPIVRETGGLRDTVLSYNEYTDEGNGFTFFNYNAHDMLHTIERAVYYYHNNKEVWYKLIVRGMTGDFSWYSSAQKYADLYASLVKPATDFTLQAEEPAAEEAPAAEPVVKEAPVAEPVVEEAPAAEPAVEKAPAAEPAVEEAPAAEPAVEEAPAAEPAVEEAPAAAEPAVEEVPAAEPAVEETPVKKPRARKTTSKKKEVETAEAPEKKPAKRTTRKKAAEAAPAEVVAEEPKAEEPAPAKQTRTRKAAPKKAENEAAPAETAEAVEEKPAPKKRASRTKKAAPAPEA